jgi:CRISPR-associated exonuclease Cas4
MLARVSDLTNYLYCPRLCYYRLRFNEDVVTEMHAARDIYISRRMNMDEGWAFEKFKSYFGDENEEIFNKSAEKFIYNPILDNLKAVEWELLLKSEKYRLKGSIDEVVRTESNSKIPLALSLSAPEKEIWFKDRIRLTAYCMLLESSEGYIYHCFDGELRKYQMGRKEKRDVLRLVERVLKIKNGFIPEKKYDKKCNSCFFKKRCLKEPSTFASKFFKKIR